MKQSYHIIQRKIIIKHYLLKEFTFESRVKLENNSKVENLTNFRTNIQDLKVNLTNLPLKNSCEQEKLDNFSFLPNTVNFTLTKRVSINPTKLILPTDFQNDIIFSLSEDIDIFRR